jgi:hypothetical protein
MKRTILCGAAMLLLFTSCNKAVDEIINRAIESEQNSTQDQFIKYSIQKGQHNASSNTYKTVDKEELKFVVKFDSTAIYQTQLPENQYDINKLYGFADNNADHHKFSARIGWRWSDKALRLFAYVYNDGVMESKELTNVAIGTEIFCNIKVAGNKYIFTVNDVVQEMPRNSNTPKAKGYQLYPYFGGDEVAPHDVNVWIKNL